MLQSSIKQYFYHVSIVVIVNMEARYVIKIHGKDVLFLVVLLVIGVIEHRGWCSPNGEGFVLPLVKNPCKIYKTIVDGTLIPS